MKNVGIQLEGLPEVTFNNSEVQLDQLQIELDPYDFVKKVISAYHDLVKVQTGDDEKAYDTLLEAVSEAIEIDIREDIEEELNTAKDKIQELEDTIEIMREC